MCASESVYRGVSRVVWGTSISDLNKSGSAQLMIRMEEILASYKHGGNVSDNEVPSIKGGILKDECDSAFWCAFASYRKTNYYKKMKEDGNLDYIEERNARFNCTN
ncbi:hypothetical protein G6F56_004631 [Rhizopus delemar]|uniref:Uncharacterized protein n=1 Tax=Rhizopus stolonifer TaxID=4846 RepID=A0A367KMU8_RHIST|nr:hypothetical protein G6F56_004631 [Rhizopus delemar]RCI03553.1 hypothetical protein CU098_009896 [Rhizopus stolonifer]